MSEEKRKLPDGWQWVKLGEVCEINPSRPLNLERTDDEPTTFVPMQAVDGNLGIIAQAQIKPFSDVRKGYTYFAENDVLFAKITPCMENGKHAIAKNLIDGIGFGTTEFHVIRPKEQIISEWVHKLLRQPKIWKLASEHFIGSVGQQRVPKEFLTNLLIPLPPLAEQKRIAAILNEQMAAVEQARKAAVAQLEAAEALPKAYLREVFESSEAITWERKRLGDVALSIQNGVYKTSDNYGQGYPFLRMYNINNSSCNLSLDKLSYVLLNQEELNKYTLEEGDILISRVNSFELVGKCAWVNDNAAGYVFENMLIRIRFDNSVNSLFIAQQMNSSEIKKQIKLAAKRAIGQSSINSEDIRDIKLFFPSINEQKRIAAYLREKLGECDGLKQTLTEQLEAINKLPAILLGRAFNGEL